MTCAISSRCQQQVEVKSITCQASRLFTRLPYLVCFSTLQWHRPDLCSHQAALTPCLNHQASHLGPNLVGMRAIDVNHWLHEGCLSHFKGSDSLDFRDRPSSLMRQEALDSENVTGIKGDSVAFKQVRRQQPMSVDASYHSDLSTARWA